MRNKIKNMSLVVAMLFFTGTSTLVADKGYRMELTKAPKDMAWTNITVSSNDTTLEDLASTYYGDVNDAIIIYEANKDIIPKSKKLSKGMVLKIPITEKYRDAPEHLGWQ
jgi:nucleoid-associated protein YgaU